jgi:hypothetical protein
MASRRLTLSPGVRYIWWGGTCETRQPTSTTCPGQCGPLVKTVGIVGCLCTVGAGGHSPLGNPLWHSNSAELTQPDVHLINRKPDMGNWIFLDDLLAATGVVLSQMGALPWHNLAQRRSSPVTHTRFRF